MLTPHDRSVLVFNHLFQALIGIQPNIAFDDLIAMIETEKVVADPYCAAVYEAFLAYLQDRRTLRSWCTRRDASW